MTKIIDKLAWLYIRDGKLLCARSKNKALFYIPGGKREQGESDEQALTREITEEVSVSLIADTIEYGETFYAPADGKAENVQVKLTCYFANFTGELAPDAEIEEIALLSYQHKNQCSAATIKVFDWLKNNGKL